MKIGDTTQYRWLEGLLAAVFILSVVDGVLTIVWVLTGYAREANFVMDYLIRLHPSIFMGIKILLMALGITLLWRNRERALAVIGIFISFIVYYAILVGFHLHAAGILISSS